LAHRLRRDNAAARGARAIGIGLAIIMGAVLLTIWSGAWWPAQPRDLIGAHANDPLKPWFEALTDKANMSCCSNADGTTVSVEDWSNAEVADCVRTPVLSFSESSGTYAGRYCVRYKGIWWLVPERATLDVPNKFGQAIIWPICQSSAHVSGADACNDSDSSLYFIRCFLPGAGT
jgi:hypothetical protein